MGPGGIGTESLVGDSRDEDWRDVQHAEAHWRARRIIFNIFKVKLIKIDMKLRNISKIANK